MKSWPTVIVTGLYAVQVGWLFWLKDWKMALVFAGYALANVGIILSMDF